ncbi:tetratricopeptide repeat protein [Acinetobacter tjernbergiae]|uniref:Sel1 repeat protein n=1 Tax=Acinetobacter tjernbergiae DSM 14971 = CIP 107465 TaxID=1120928 RepID=V2UYA6_9GAMM|nr:SEL1-like repeat protein [Acinetobacter tjernbergiae]ESK53606.1 hypothetical protein F990_03281 [Acinetobacter tjernbergiae DSM 14971 = CIP 107465]
MEANELVEKAKNIANQDNPDNEQAYKLLLNAYEKGSPEATYAIATWYLHGYYVERDLKLAFLFLKEAAGKSWPDALFDLAFSYEEGIYVKKNRKKLFICIYRRL